MKTKTLLKFKVGKHKIKVEMGKWHNFIHGVLCGIGGIIISSLIMFISGLNSYTSKLSVGVFYYLVAFVFAYVLIFKTELAWNKFIKRRKRRRKND